jgi:hypothetical protein
MAETVQRVVRVRRQASGFTASCNCGFGEECAGPGDAVRGLVEHVRAEHPDFLARLLAATYPPEEYCEPAVPAAEFAAMMRRWLALPAPGTASRRSRAAKPRRRRGESG